MKQHEEIMFFLGGGAHSSDCVSSIQLFHIFCIKQYLYIFKFLRILCCKLYTDIYFDGSMQRIMVV